jgi:hypothetical protein
MTPLLKSVFRTTRGGLDGSYGPDRGRLLVVGQEVGDLISFRPLGTRRKVNLSIFDAYRFAIRCEASRLERRARDIQKLTGSRFSTALKSARKEAV